jgi:hypothetical protein
VNGATVGHRRKKMFRTSKRYLKMVQTRAGVANSEWMNFVKECTVVYHARKAGIELPFPPITACRCDGSCKRDAIPSKGDVAPVKPPRGRGKKKSLT